MRAAVCYEFGQPLVVEEIEIDSPQWGELRVRVSACGICHSDLHRLRGERGGALPIVAGHEAERCVGPTVARPSQHPRSMPLRRLCFHFTGVSIRT